MKQSEIVKALRPIEGHRVRCIDREFYVIGVKVLPPNKRMMDSYADIIIIPSHLQYPEGYVFESHTIKSIEVGDGFFMLHLINDAPSVKIEVLS